MTVAEDLSLIETQKEFVRRYRSKSTDSKAIPMFTSSCPGKFEFVSYSRFILLLSLITNKIHSGGKSTNFFI